MLVLLFDKLFPCAGREQRLGRKHVAGDAVLVRTALQQDAVLRALELLFGVLQVVEKDWVRAVDPRVDNVDWNVLT